MAVAKLRGAVARVEQYPDVKQQFARLGTIPIDMTPAALGRFIERALEKWTKVIQAGGIQPGS